MRALRRGEECAAQEGGAAFFRSPPRPTTTGLRSRDQCEGGRIDAGKQVVVATGAQRAATIPEASAGFPERTFCTCISEHYEKPAILPAGAVKWSSVRANRVVRSPRTCIGLVAKCTLRQRAAVRSALLGATSPSGRSDGDTTTFPTTRIPIAIRSGDKTNHDAMRRDGDTATSIYASSPVKE